MSDNKISRRQIIKVGSIAAMSTVVSPLIASAKSNSVYFEQNNLSISGADGEICFMSAVDMAALLRNKKISAREVMQAHLKQIEKVNVVGNPALSVPCAFSKTGLPIGIQIVGRHNKDMSVLQMGYAFEQATNIGKRRPKIVE